MQQKFLWGGAVLVVLGAAATFLSVDYARRHPQGVLARLAVIATFTGLNPNPLADVNRLFSGEDEEPCEPMTMDPVPNMPPTIDPPDSMEETIEPIQIEALPQATVEPPIYDGVNIIDTEEFGIEISPQASVFMQRVIHNPVDETPIPMPSVDDGATKPIMPNLNGIMNRIIRGCGLACFDLCLPRETSVGSGDNKQDPLSDDWDFFNGGAIDAITNPANCSMSAPLMQNENCCSGSRSIDCLVNGPDGKLYAVDARYASKLDWLLANQSQASEEEQEAGEEESQQLIDPPAYDGEGQVPYLDRLFRKVGPGRQAREEQAEEEQSQQLIDPPALGEGEEEQAAEEESQELIDPPSYRGWPNRWWHWKNANVDNDASAQEVEQAFFYLQQCKAKYLQGGVSINEYANARVKYEDCRAKRLKSFSMSVNSAARFFLLNMN